MSVAVQNDYVTHLEGRIIKLTEGIDESREETARLLARRDGVVLDLYNQGISVSQIAKLIHTTTNNVRQAMDRARARQ